MKSKEKKSGYGTAIAVVLGITAVIVVTAVTLLALYYTGVIGDVETVRKIRDEGKKEEKETDEFIDYKVPSPLPTGRYATITLTVDGKDYSVEAFLLSGYAPNTVSNFVSHANDDFYNGTVFGADKDALKSGKVVCGGYVRSSDGTISQKIPVGGASPIKGEFTENGYEYNRIGNKAGVLGMIHSGRSNDDATTDFYILTEDDESLNGKFAPFAVLTTESEINLVKVLASRAKNGENVTIKSIKIHTKV